MSTDSEKKITSLFLIQEDDRLALTKHVDFLNLTGNKTSKNDCLLIALSEYLEKSISTQQEPISPAPPLRQFTVRTSPALKQQVLVVAANWQIKTGMPVSMNAVFNTALKLYLQKHHS